LKPLRDVVGCPESNHERRVFSQYHMPNLIYPLPVPSWLGRPRVTCEIVPRVHAFEQLEARGFSPEEVRRAVLAGSKERKSENEYLGTYGVCKVKVVEAPCTLYVITVMTDSKE
jgi:hypothetical protein